VLKPHEAEITKLEALDESYKEQVAERIWMMSRPPERLWADLEELCNEHDRLTDDDFDFACRMVEGLGRYSNQFADQMLAIIRGDIDNLMKGFAMLLAGEWRLEAAVPDLMKAIDTDDDWIFEESQNALVKIGTEAVVRQFAKEWPTASWTFRMSAAVMLEYIHSDLSVQTALDLVPVEEDQLIQGLLLRAVLMNFATEGIEPARQYILNTPLDPDVLDVRSALLVACKLLGERFPEFDAWLEDSTHDREFRAKWRKEHSGGEEEIEVGEEQEVIEPPVSMVPTTSGRRRSWPVPSSTKEPSRSSNDGWAATCKAIRKSSDRSRSFSSGIGSVRSWQRIEISVARTKKGRISRSVATALFARSGRGSREAGREIEVDLLRIGDLATQLATVAPTAVQ